MQLFQEFIMHVMSVQLIVTTQIMFVMSFNVGHEKMYVYPM